MGEVMLMCVATGGMTTADAHVHLSLLAQTVPDWLQLLPQGAHVPERVRISRRRNVVAVRQRLEDAAFGFDQE